MTCWRRRPLLAAVHRPPPDFSRILPPDFPQREKLLQTIDDVAVLIKTQQSAEGGVLAGYPYPLAYVRDQYGVSRGLSTLGYFDEAKAILEFYWKIGNGTARYTTPRQWA